MASSSCFTVAAPNATPFVITAQEAQMLDKSEGFQILRRHLSRSLGFGFCEEHEGKSPEAQQSWFVIRDVLHAMLAPIVALQEHSTMVAHQSLQTARQEDLDYAFYGNARNAFVWLQSFMAADETQWCLSIGCPACVVTQALDSESSIRLLMASCLLSGMQNDIAVGQPQLPSLAFFMRSIADAMLNDDLWGADYFQQVEPKAVALHGAIQELMYQCQDVENNVTPPESPDSVLQMSFAEPTSEGMPVKRSRFAKKQAKMLREEAQWLRTVDLDRWDATDYNGCSSPIAAEFIRRMSTFSIDT